MPPKGPARGRALLVHNGGGHVTPEDLVKLLFFMDYPFEPPSQPLYQHKTNPDPSADGPVSVAPASATAAASAAAAATVMATTRDHDRRYHGSLLTSTPTRKDTS